MSPVEIVRIALAALRNAKLRSFLTTLGIVIGVAAVITMVALGRGAQHAVETQLQALGTDLLTISPGQSYWRGVARGERVSLTSDDAAALMRNGRTLKSVVPTLGDDLQVKLGNRNLNVDIVATTAEFAAVQRFALAVGRFFSRADDYGRRRVAVLGDDIPGELEIAPAAVVGRSITIRGIPFDVIGVLQPKGELPGRDDPDETIYIPFRTGEYRIFGSDRLQSITVQLADPESTQAALLDIERVLRQTHRLRPDEPNDFRIRDRTAFLTAQAEARGTLTYLLAGIAAVSLIVGGIGIMNIMLVSVTERTREIGLRKAMGASRRTILLQFLVEAVTLCVIGGVCGIVVGTVAASVVARLNGWAVLVTPAAVALAVGFSVAVGLFFGVWPARRASRLDPIEALRYE
ncbi:MAG: ABC transporter permease [Gemmatimonadales bacterium]